MTVDLLAHSPFTSYVVPGALLFVVFGIGSLVAALVGLIGRMGLWRHAMGPYLAFAVGAGQMIWIAVELVMVRTFHPVMHPLLFTWGALLAALAFIWWRGSARQA